MVGETSCHIHKKVTRARVMQGLADTGRRLSMSGIFGREVGKIVWPVRGANRVGRVQSGSPAAKFGLCAERAGRMARAWTRA